MHSVIPSLGRQNQAGHSQHEAGDLATKGVPGHIWLDTVSKTKAALPFGWLEITGRPFLIALEAALPTRRVSMVGSCAARKGGQSCQGFPWASTVWPTAFSFPGTCWGHPQCLPSCTSKQSSVSTSTCIDISTLDSSILLLQQQRLCFQLEPHL